MRPAALGSHLKELHPAARINSALSAQNFHTCRAKRVFPDVHAAGKNELEFVSPCAAKFSEAFFYECYSIISSMLPAMVNHS